MTSVRRRGNSWMLDYRDANGRRLRKVVDAKSKGEAKRLLEELAGQVRRQKLGLEDAPAESTLTLWELCGWWLRSRCPKASRKIEGQRLSRHIEKTELGAMLLRDVTAAELEKYFSRMERDGYAPAAINKLRSMLHAAYASARKKNARVWMGANPVTDTEPRYVPKVTRETLQVHEVEKVLAKVPPQWRGFFATAIYLALRKGEIAGLLKRDVDMVSRTVFVRRSYDAPTTKGEHEDGLPIPGPLVPYFVEALEGSPGELMFPDENGKMRTREADPHKILRTALKAAKIVTGRDLLAWLKGPGPPL